MAVGGMQGKVTISHAFCLGMSDRARAHELIERLAEARVAIAAVATPSRPVPSAVELREAGVKDGLPTNRTDDAPRLRRSTCIRHFR